MHRSCGILLFLCCLGTAAAQSRSQEVLWQPPGNVAAKDFAYGSGGRQGVPRPPFVFVQEDQGGTNPKVKIQDAAGRLWLVKWGPEVQPEVFASRLAWALGYFVQPSYFIAKGQIAGAHHLTRARDSIHHDGSFRDARFKLLNPSVRYLSGHGWAWTHNPFLGTKELNGLKVLLMLTSNWDAKDSRDPDSNTAIFIQRVGRSERYFYSVDDWGASMGRWGNFFTREKWDCKGFVQQTPDFVKGAKDGILHWGFTGKHASDLNEGVSARDVQWLLQSLSQVTDRQLSAGLQASGADASEAGCFTMALRERIRQMQEVVRLSLRPVPPGTRVKVARR